MQFKSWNDLRYLLAVKRGRSLAGAARLIGVDDTTVSRRLQALQSAAGAELWRRQPDGSLVLTAEGETVVQHVEAMAHRVDLIEELLGEERHRGCTGTVRLTSVPIVVNRLLAPRAGALLDPHPGLQLELVPDSRDLSLTRREADLAVRLARPTAGGNRVKTRRIGDLSYAAYVPRACSSADAAAIPWITYDDALAHLPQARWIARVTRGRPEQLAGVRVHDAETALEAVVAGVGRTLLPSLVADPHPQLRRLAPESGAPPPPARELWLLAHADQLELRRIRAVIAWIDSVMGLGVAARRRSATLSCPGC